MWRITSVAASLILPALTLAAPAQQSAGGVPTQILVTVEGRSGSDINPGALSLSVNDHKQPLTGFSQLDPAKTQVAILMDAGLRISVGRELDTLRQFVRSLPDGVEVLVGSMQYGSVRADQPFTTDREAAAAALHLPQGLPGSSGSPYLCLSDFVKKWPETSKTTPDAKARIVLMISNGVDPYNGSTSVMNQDSPYVATAVTDAQRAGVAVYSIYYGDAGMGGAQTDLSGQSYLSQVAQGTGGMLFTQGNRSPVSMAPFLDQFKRVLGETYIASFTAPADDRHLVRVKMSAPGMKVHSPQAVRVGNLE